MHKQLNTFPICLLSLHARGVVTLEAGVDYRMEKTTGHFKEICYTDMFAMFFGDFTAMTFEYRNEKHSLTNTEIIATFI